MRVAVAGHRRKRRSLTFMEYVLAAVQTSFPDACPQTEAMVRSPNPVPVSMLGAMPRQRP